MCAAFLGFNVSAWIQALAGIDTDGRAHAKRTRRELFGATARVVHHARRVVSRVSPAGRRGPLLRAWAALQALPAAASP